MLYARRVITREKRKFRHPLEIYYTQLNAVQLLPDLSRMINLRYPYANPEHDFRDDPAYRLGYSQEIVTFELCGPERAFQNKQNLNIYLPPYRYL